MVVSTKWVLGLEPQSSERAAGALNYWAITSSQLGDLKTYQQTNYVTTWAQYLDVLKILNKKEMFLA